MYKKILAPIDGSEFSECAVEHIKAIAVGCKVPEVVLFRVIEPVHTVYGVSDEWMKDTREQAKAYINEYLSKIAEVLAGDGISSRIVIVDGYAANEILTYANKNNVDLIIMSTHGSSGFIRWTLGSVTDKVAHHSPVPVMIVTPKTCREYRQQQ